MSANSPLLTALSRAPVLPVVVIDDANDAIPLAEALLRGGITAIEITLRTDAALQAMAQVAKSVPQMLVGAGTVVSPRDLHAASDHGARFAVSPGISSTLLKARTEHCPLLPGVATASEIMLGLEHGVDFFKFFPASISGGVDALKAFSGPFAKLRFCPTGGINIHNAGDYLALNNVVCVGGSWLTPAHAIKNKDWQHIETLCRTAVQTLQKK